jgi:hypothetical protein
MGCSEWGSLFLLVYSFSVELIIDGVGAGCCMLVVMMSSEVAYPTSEVGYG